MLAGEGRKINPHKLRQKCGKERGLVSPEITKSR